jgi:hypothetical protein
MAPLLVDFGLGGNALRLAAIAALESSAIVNAGAGSFMPSRKTKVDGGTLPFASAARSCAVAMTRSTPCSSE